MSSYSELIADNDARNSEIAAFVAELLSERTGPGIVFARTRAHAANLSGALHELGIEAPVVTALMPVGQRTQLAELMRNGHQQVAVATAVWNTGLDVPGLAWVVLTGSGSAPIGLLQASGRATRPGKPAFIVYDVCDVNADAPYLARHNARRRQHHAGAGFVRDDPVELLQQVLADEEQPGRRRRSETTDYRADDPRYWTPERAETYAKVQAILAEKAVNPEPLPVDPMGRAFGRFIQVAVYGIIGLAVAGQFLRCAG